MDTKDGMSVEVDYPYRKIDLFIGETTLQDMVDKKFSDRMLDLYLTHEALHVLFWEFADRAADRYVSEKELENQEEKLVDKLAHILCK